MAGAGMAGMNIHDLLNPVVSESDRGGGLFWGFCVLNYFKKFKKILFYGVGNFWLIENSENSKL